VTYTSCCRFSQLISPGEGWCFVRRRLKRLQAFRRAYGLSILPDLLFRASLRQVAANPLPVRYSPPGSALRGAFRFVRDPGLCRRRLCRNGSWRCWGQGLVGNGKTAVAASQHGASIGCRLALQRVCLSGVPAETSLGSRFPGKIRLLGVAASILRQRWPWGRSVAALEATPKIWDLAAACALCSPTLGFARCCGLQNSPEARLMLAAKPRGTVIFLPWRAQGSTATLDVVHALGSRALLSR